MANTTIRGALSIHGTNPQYLIEKVIRSRIYDSIYWSVSARPASSTNSLTPPSLAHRGALLRAQLGFHH